jgi:transcriptional regulator with XRE-family HTH domain
MLMTTTARKKALLDAKVSAADVARMLDVSEALVSLVISGKRTTGPDALRVMAKLSELTGVPVVALFPGTEGTDRREGDRRMA